MATSDPRGMRSIDGSHGEGGGQLVRTAVSLSAITGDATRIHNIRAGRERPGLRAQHVTAVLAAAELCGATVSGASLGSRGLCFEPTEPPRPGRYRWEIGTAGAVTLVLQTVLWPLALAPGSSTVSLVGGTHVMASPPVDYVQEVYLPLMGGVASSRPGGLPVATVTVERWGWYPRGGGAIEAEIRGSVKLRGLRLLERGPLRSVSVLSAASNLPEHIRQRQASRADFLLRKMGIRARVQTLAPPSPGKGTVVFVRAQYAHARAGFTSYGRMRKPAEQVAAEACKAFSRYHKRGQPVDAHAGDQVLLPMALAAREGEQSLLGVESVTQHLLTQVWVIQQFLPQVEIRVQGAAGTPGTVEIGPRAGTVRNEESYV